MTHKQKKSLKTPKKSGDVPTTVRHLQLVRKELKSDITSLRLEMKAGFTRVEGILFDMKAMLEEQNERNRYVLDGYTSLYDKSKDTDGRLDRLESHVFGVKQK